MVDFSEKGRGLFDAAGGDAGGGVDNYGVGEDVVETASIVSQGRHDYDDGKQG